jgi:hypothetical protein
VLDSLFFTEEPWLKLSVYFNNKKGRICSAEQPNALNGSRGIYQRLALGMARLEHEL